MVPSTATTPRRDVLELGPPPWVEGVEGPAPLAGTPVAVVASGEGPVGPELRDALLDAGAAVATVGPGASVPPGTRWVVNLAGLPASGGPDGKDDNDEPGLGPDSVVLVTGGGRGIGARAAIALARAFGCGIELVGPDDAPFHLAGRDDTVAVRRAILGRGELGRPGEIAVERERTLAAREIRRTLADLSEHAAFAGYRALDVADAAALAAAIDDIRTQHGRLDGVVRVAEVPPRAGGRGCATRLGAAPGEVA
jgi:hypothetical protein